MLADWTRAPVSDRVRAGLRLCEVLTKHPSDLDAELIAELRRAGLDDAALEDAANVAFHFNLINRLADAFDFPLLDDAQRAKMARILDRAGRTFGGTSRGSVTGADGLVRPVEVERGRAHMLACPGVTEPELRRAVEAYAASWFGGERGSTPTQLPEPVRVYVEKLARWAYKIVDEDVEALRADGLGDEAIFELSLVAAMGASVVGLERLYGALA